MYRQVGQNSPSLQTSSFASIRRSRTGSDSSFITANLRCNLDISNGRSYSGSGSTVTDLSGNSTNATLTNTPTYSRVNGGVLTFNGSNQYGSIPGTLLSGNQFTVSVWVKNNANVGSTRILSKDTGTNRDWAIQMTPTTLNWIAWNSSGTFYQFSPTYTFDNNVWYNIVCTYSSVNNEMRVYVNGISLGSLTTTGTIRSTTSVAVAVGRFAGNNTEHYNGLIAKASIYTSTTATLTDSEILNNFNADRRRFGV